MRDCEIGRKELHVNRLVSRDTLLGGSRMQPCDLLLVLAAPLKPVAVNINEVDIGGKEGGDPTRIVAVPSLVPLVHQCLNSHHVLRAAGGFLSSGRSRCHPEREPELGEKSNRVEHRRHNCALAFDEVGEIMLQASAIFNISRQASAGSADNSRIRWSGEGERPPSTPPIRERRMGQFYFGDLHAIVGQLSIGVDTVAREPVKLTEWPLPMAQSENSFEAVAAKRVFKAGAKMTVATRTDGANQSLIILKRPKLTRDDMLPIEILVAEFLPAVDTGRHGTPQPLTSRRLLTFRSGPSVTLVRHAGPL
jgi:hypothetical protein